MQYYIFQFVLEFIIIMSVFSNSAITLKYWNGRGLMEVPRMILAIAGKFPVRFSYVNFINQLTLYLYLRIDDDFNSKLY